MAKHLQGSCLHVLVNSPICLRSRHGMLGTDTAYRGASFLANHSGAASELTLCLDTWYAIFGADTAHAGSPRSERSCKRLQGELCRPSVRTVTLCEARYLHSIRRCQMVRWIVYTESSLSTLRNLSIDSISDAQF